MKYLIALLLALNLAQGALYLHARRSAPTVYGERVEQVRLETANGGAIDITLGSSRSGGQNHSVLVLTPHAAVQLHAEMSRAFTLIEQAARAPRVTQ